MSISADHSNRRAYNWLIYELTDQALIRHADLFRGRLVDLGCGEKPYRDFFLQHCSEYIGVDWAQSLHELSADVVTDLNEPLPFADQSVDTIVSISVLEHLSEPQALLAEAYRILGSGGNLIVQVPFQWKVHEAPYDYFRYTRYGLDHVLSKAGFVDILIEPTSGFWAMWFLKLNYQLRTLIRGPRMLRAFSQGILTPIWWLTQATARILDRYWRGEGETAGYVAVARRS